nr:Ig-like domain-containing protein [Bartonella sp. HY038]
MIYTIKVTGTLETGDTVWMRIKPEGGTAGQWIQATKNADGTYSVNHNDADHALTDGRYTIETVVRDAAGNPSLHQLKISKSILKAQLVARLRLAAIL